MNLGFLCSRFLTILSSSLVPYSDWAIFDSSFQLPPRVFGSCTVWMIFIFDTFCFKFWVLFKSTITCLATTTSHNRLSPLTEPSEHPQLVVHRSPHVYWSSSNPPSPTWPIPPVSSFHFTLPNHPLITPKPLLSSFSHVFIILASNCISLMKALRYCKPRLTNQKHT